MLTNRIDKAKLLRLSAITMRYTSITILIQGLVALVLVQIDQHFNVVSAGLIEELLFTVFVMPGLALSFPFFPLLHDLGLMRGDFFTLPTKLGFIFVYLFWIVALYLASRLIDRK